MATNTAGPPAALPAGPVLWILVSLRGVERLETTGALADQLEALRLGQLVLPALGFVNAAVGRYRPLRPRPLKVKRAPAIKGAAGEE